MSSENNLPESFDDVRSAVAALHKIEDAGARDDERDDEDNQSARPQGEADPGQDENLATEEGDDEDVADDETEDGEQPKAAIVEPPVSFTADEKVEFSKLPPEMQQTVARRESERSRAFDQRSQQLAEERRALEPVAQRFTQLEQRYVQALDAIFTRVLAPELQRAQAEWSSKTVSDPAEAVRLQGVIAQAESWKQYLGAEIQQAQANQVQLSQRNAEARMQAEFPQLIAKVPELADAQKQQPLVDDIVGTMRTYGFQPNELGVALTDHRMMHFMADAAKALKAQQTRQSALSKRTTTPAPMLMRPNAKSNRNESRNTNIKKAQAQLDRSGRIEDAMALLRLT